MAIVESGFIKQNQKMSSVFDVLDGLLCEFYLPQSARHQLPHLLAPVQDLDGLLVLIRIDLDLVDELLVDQLVLVNEHQQPIQL